MRIRINSPIDIHAYDECAFRWSCEKGYLPIVVYLINYANLINSPINIHAERESGFRKSCEKGHLSLVEYLINYAILSIVLLIFMMTENMLFV